LLKHGRSVFTSGRTLDDDDRTCRLGGLITSDRGQGRWSLLSCGMFSNEVTIIFFDATPEELQQHDKTDDSNARACEGTRTAYMPGLGDETSVDGIPVPEHLVGHMRLVSHLMARDWQSLTEILQLPPISPWSMVIVDEDVLAVAVGVGAMEWSME